MDLITGKDRSSTIAAAYDAAEVALDRRLRVMTVVTGVFGSLVMGVLALGGMTITNDDLVGMSCACLPFMGIAGGMTVYGAYKRIRAARDKLKFAREVNEVFRDDVHPALKIRHQLDLRNYDTADKKYWEGRSAHGNSKYRYADRWFRSKFTLVDGTVVVVERRGDVKVRKGSVMRHKRRLYLRIVPSPAHFGEGPYAGGSDLEQMVRQVVKSSFHDPPEGLKVRRESAADSIQLKVTQLDAPILGNEVLALVEGVLLYLRMR